MATIFYKGEDITLTFRSNESLAGFQTKVVKYFTPFSVVKTAVITAVDQYSFLAKLPSADTADLPAGTLNIVLELVSTTGKCIGKTVRSKLADAYANGCERESSDPFTGVVLVQNQEVDINFTASAGANTQIKEERLSGVVDGTNKTYTTSTPYVAGSISVFVNGLKQMGFTETNNTSITLEDAPLNSGGLEDKVEAIYMQQ